MLATIKNLFLFFRDFMGVRIRCGFFDIVVKDGSSPAVSCLNFELRSQILFETKYEKKTKRYYLCYNISGNFFKLSKIKRQSVVADLTLFDYYKVGAIEVFYR